MWLALLACRDPGAQRAAGEETGGETATVETGESAESGDTADSGGAAETHESTDSEDSGEPEETGEPPDCPTPAAFVFYTQSAWNVLADALAADPSPCADYWISLPANSGDKTTPRAEGEPETMRARSSRFHAAAEFHWATWSDEPGDWYDKGVLFRERMVEAGYDVAAGDTWAVNELPSTVRSDPSVRADTLELFRGLYEGGAPVAQGIVFISGMGHATENFSVYKPYVQDWLEDADYWAAANLHVRHWAQEVYADPDHTCVADTTVAEVSAALNPYVEHFAWQAEVGPDSANTAQSYMGRAYLPLMNAVWNSADDGYGNTAIDLESMFHFVSHQVYAARAWADSHNHPDGRVGFAWARYDVDDADLSALGERLASALHHAYDEGGGSAAGACSPSGAYTWCACEVEGAAFNAGWETFGSW
jgi:hypothetical protein